MKLFAYVESIVSDGNAYLMKSSFTANTSSFRDLRRWKKEKRFIPARQPR